MAKRKRRSARSKASVDLAQTARLIEQCRQGDAAAEEIVFARYVNRLTALARSRLSRRLSARLDPSDVVMSAYRSFFIGLRGGGVVLFAETGLWRFVVPV